MGSGTLAVIGIWLAGIAAICRNDPLGRLATGAAVALIAAALIGLLN
ncbi:hypothetical protein [Lichenicoccus sp.]